MFETQIIPEALDTYDGRVGKKKTVIATVNTAFGKPRRSPDRRALGIRLNIKSFYGNLAIFVVLDKFAFREAYLARVWGLL